jgi:hypothetical protein
LGAGDVLRAELRQRRGTEERDQLIAVDRQLLLVGERGDALGPTRMAVGEPDRYQAGRAVTHDADDPAWGMVVDLRPGASRQVPSGRP